ncbi:MAG: LysR family transcriptional regulator [Burkholderiaceae bacterium]|nr:LysR family transcriptional regulator [Burkholderiaceae bacterium]
MSKRDSEVAAPLNAVRVFVEAARQLNFSRAARALGITQGGVSRHVATLERHLGFALFHRQGTAVTLSDGGRLYFDAVQEPMAAIELASRQMAQRQPAAGRLIVRTSLPTFAMGSLIPALPHFAATPPVGVDLVTSLDAPGPDDAYDVLITRDLHLGDAEQWLLCSEVLVCVAAPQRQRDWAQRPVAEWQFLATHSRPEALLAWARQVRPEGGAPAICASFDHYFLAIPAAMAGMGHLVAPLALVAVALSQGQLVLATPDLVRRDASYQAYVNPRSARPETARHFCRWLKAWLRDAALPA